jgi:hypothetical protein
MFKLYCVSCDVSFPIEARSLVALHASEWMGAIAKGRRLRDQQLADMCE